MAIFRDNSENPVEHDRSIEDRRRHRQLVEKSIKENLGDILSEESIVGETKNKKFKFFRKKCLTNLIFLIYF